MGSKSMGFSLLHSFPLGSSPSSPLPPLLSSSSTSSLAVSILHRKFPRINKEMVYHPIFNTWKYIRNFEQLAHSSLCMLRWWRRRRTRPMWHKDRDALTEHPWITYFFFFFSNLHLLALVNPQSISMYARRRRRRNIIVEPGNQDFATPFAYS